MYRRKITELIALYELEPEIRQVWVEGAYDKRLLTWYTYESKIDRVNIGTIDSIEVPISVLEKYGLSSGNRNRIIALALELESTVTNVECGARVICVADLDFDKFIDRSIVGALVRYTDFTSLEMYLFDAAVIQKFISLMTEGLTISADQLMENLSRVGSELFMVRAANEVLGWGMSLPDPIKLMDIDNNFELTFDCREYINRILNSNSRSRFFDQFASAIEACKRKATDEPRSSIRGHDFIDIFYFIVHTYVRPKEAARSIGSLPGLLTMAADASSLQSFRLFSEINAAFPSEGLEEPKGDDYLAKYVNTGGVSIGDT